MEMTSIENSQPSTLSANDTDDNSENLVPNQLNHGEAETKCEVPEEELKGILGVIAATGKYWHEWDTLKGLLSFKLKQVWGEYPEAKMTSDLQISSLGEPFSELVKRLDEAILSFIEGPPFTLQRLCEILLAAQSIYPNLSKLALALEKNLLVTSTLPICTDPYPSDLMQTLDEPDQGSEILQMHSSAVQNGDETTLIDRDEELPDAGDDDDYNKPIDIDSLQKIVNGSSETSSLPRTDAEPSNESSPSNQQNNAQSS